MPFSSNGIPFCGGKGVVFRVDKLNGETFGIFARREHDIYIHGQVAESDTADFDADLTGAGFDRCAREGGRFVIQGKQAGNLFFVSSLENNAVEGRVRRAFREREA